MQFTHSTKNIVTSRFAAGLGIELTMEAGIALHLTERFDLSVTHASALASLFGVMNIFTRGFGGWFSDKMYKHYSLRGRLGIHWLFMLLEGVFIFLFCKTTILFPTLLAMITFASFGQMSMGSCFSIIPYCDPPNTGTIAGKYTYSTML
jgi:NNP family nitrate/nitrite transporter-like MFS transporter